MFKPSYVQFEKHPASLSQIAQPGEDLPLVSTLEGPTEETGEQVDFGWTTVIGQLHKIPVQTADEKKQRDGLVSALMPLLLEAEQFAQKVLAVRRVELQKEWRKLRSECRKQSNLVRQLEYKVQNAEAVVQSAIESQAHAMTNLQVASDPRQLPAYFSDEEKETMQTNIAKARKHADDASKELSYAINQRFQVQQELKQAQGRMQELGTSERRVRHALDGRKFYDAEFGLSAQAGA